MSVIKKVSSTTLYKNHGKGVGYWTIELVELTGGEAGGIITHAKGKGSEEVSSSFISKPKNVGKANETTALEQAASEVESRINKKLDLGYVRTEEEAKLPATNASGRKMPMLAHKIQDVDPDAIDWDNAFSQPKLDGHCALNEKGVYSRQGKDIHLPHIEQTLKDMGLANLPLHGELYIHGMPLKDIGSLIKKPREESTQVEYHLYDLMLDIPFMQRHVMLAASFGGQAFHPDTQGSGPIKLVATVKVESHDARVAMNAHWVKLGYEGDMLRHGTSGYEDGKRSRQILKGKLRDDHEFKVVGYEEAKPRISRDAETQEVVNVQQAPIWVMDLGDGSGKTFKVLAHGTAYEKDEQWTQREAKIGCLLTVSHLGYTPDGIPREPIAERWKEDI
ncbi:putative DNA ligase [Pseudomonas phage UAntarctica]|nr:putative DNA ligase [Pseudomonas phage UAntarctica]